MNEIEKNKYEDCEQCKEAAKMAFKMEFSRLFSNFHLDIRATSCMPADSIGLFSLWHGDIANQKFHEVIVCPVNRHFTNGAGVSAALFRKDGEMMSDALQRAQMAYNDQKDKTDFVISVVPVKSERVKTTAICFVAVDDTMEEYSQFDNLYDLYFNIIKTLLYKTSYESVIFPLIGTGAGGVPITISAEAAMEAFTKFKRKKDMHPLSVVLLGKDENAYNLMQNASHFCAYKSMVTNLLYSL